MSSALKIRIVEELTQKIQGVKNYIFVNYHGLSANQTTELRAYLQESGIKMHILKNSLGRRVFEQPRLQPMTQFLNGPTAMIFGLPGAKGADAVLLSKKMITWQGKNKIPEIRGGYLEGRVVSPAEIRQLSFLPSREVMLGLLASVLNAPMTRLACGLKGVISKLGYALHKLAEQRSTLPQP